MYHNLEGAKWEINLNISGVNIESHRATVGARSSTAVMYEVPDNPIREPQSRHYTLCTLMLEKYITLSSCDHIEVEYKDIYGYYVQDAW
jgi:hypothetical protein